METETITVSFTSNELYFLIQALKTFQFSGTLEELEQVVSLGRSLLEKLNESNGT